MVIVNLNIYKSWTRKSDQCGKLINQLTLTLQGLPGCKIKIPIAFLAVTSFSVPT